MSDASLGLGIDAGGTKTRWALARASGEIVASGEAPGMSAHLMRSSDGRQRVRETLAKIAEGALAVGRPARIQAGVTGLPERPQALRALVAQSFGLEEDAIGLENDLVFVYRGLFAPGEGYVVYAGTGSIAAYIDPAGGFHRAGGWGPLLDDAGSGYWIALEALRRIWRQEDERPGTWRDSPLAREIFSRLGGSDWANTREAVYGGDRGEIGRLALAVAATAGEDPAARSILEAAGRELARLANALLQRFGPRPIALTGRAVELHPVIGEVVRASLPPDTPLEIRSSEAHFAAARLAARS